MYIHIYIYYVCIHTYIYVLLLLLPIALCRCSRTVQQGTACTVCAVCTICTVCADRTERTIGTICTICTVCTNHAVEYVQIVCIRTYIYVRTYVIDMYVRRYSVPATWYLVPKMHTNIIDCEILSFFVQRGHLKAKKH